MEFLPLSRRRSSAWNVPSGKEREETEFFAGYIITETVSASEERLAGQKKIWTLLNRILRLLSFQFMVAWVTLLWAIYGSPTVFSRHLKSLELSDLGFELLMQISWLHIECAAN